MKKVIAVITAIILLVFSFPILANTIDLNKSIIAPCSLPKNQEKNIVLTESVLRTTSIFSTNAFFLIKADGYKLLAEQEAERKARIEAEQKAKKEAEERAKREAKVTEQLYSASSFRSRGVLHWGSYKWTWYSEKVLSGGGLNIPGRHADNNGYICDGNNYICLASSTLPKGTIVNTPLGKQGKVYDSGCAAGVIDVYVNW